MTLYDYYTIIYSYYGHTLYVLHCKLVCKYQCYVFWMILYDFEEKTRLAWQYVHIFC